MYVCALFRCSVRQEHKNGSSLLSFCEIEQEQQNVSVSGPPLWFESVFVVFGKRRTREEFPSKLDDGSLSADAELVRLEEI